jgi:hypothetical protein
MLNPKITRRIFIGACAFVVTAPVFAYRTNEQTGVLETTQQGQFFNSNELTMLNDVAEIMIPKTTTPGAIDANVILVLDGLMLTWANDVTKLQYKTLLIQLEKLAMDTFKQAYLLSAKSDRIALITELDKRAFANQTTDLSKNYRKLKELVFHIYYTSEEANPDYVLIPGTYKGCVSLAEHDAMVSQRLGRTS